MKLAEALLLRADIQTRLARLTARIASNAVVQQGDVPHEDPEKLIAEALGVIRELEAIVIRINRTNMRHKMADGRTLTEAVAARDALKQQHAVLNAAVEGTNREPDRYSVREIKWVAQLDVGKLNKQMEDLARKVRELNGRLQETNWAVELEE